MHRGTRNVLAFALGLLLVYSSYYGICDCQKIILDSFKLYTIDAFLGLSLNYGGYALGSILCPVASFYFTTKQILCEFSFRSAQQKNSRTRCKLINNCCSKTSLHHLYKSFSIYWKHTWLINWWSIDKSKDVIFRILIIWKENHPLKTLKSDVFSTRNCQFTVSDFWL